MAKLAISLTSAEETGRFGLALADRLRAHAVSRGLVLLQGDLGAGKSSLVRAVLRGYGVEGPIPSPTYTLVEPYQIGDQPIQHLDLYRLAAPDEIEALGGRELFDALAFVEWPERVPTLFADANLQIKLELDGQGRRVTLISNDSTPIWTHLVAEAANLLQQS